MTPMTKNITVIDENGIKAGYTYPKRAAGLVKKGRAHWISSDTVCLCADKTEETKMPDNIYDVIDNQFSKLQNQLRDIPNADSVSNNIIDALVKLQTKNKELEIKEKQLDVLNNIMKEQDIEIKNKLLKALGEIAGTDDKEIQPDIKIEYKADEENSEAKTEGEKEV